jgi:hypothetical protein
MEFESTERPLIGTAAKVAWGQRSREGRRKESLEVPPWRNGSSPHSMRRPVRTPPACGFARIERLVTSTARVGYELSKETATAKIDVRI